MRLTVLGCSGSYPRRGGACSGYLVQAEGLNIWLDAGSGTLANLQRHIDLADISCIVISHEHPDHWSDLDGFAVARKYGEFERTGPLVLAPSGVREAMHIPFTAAEMTWVTVSDGERVKVADVHLVFSRTDHGGETLAVRISGGGRSLGYSADSGPGWSLEALGPGVDLALCEATFLQDREGTMQHLSGRQAGAMARAAGVGRLIVTHAWPTLDPDEIAAEAGEAFGAPVTAATEGMVVEV